MSKVNRFINLIIGLLIVAITFNLFFLPNNLVAGSISGLSIIINKLFGISTALFVLIANIILILISHITLGKEATKNTIIGSILLPIFIKITSPLPTLINLSSIDILINGIIGGILSGFGYGLIFKAGYTSGGTDILDFLVSKYFKVSMNKSILLVDGIIVLMGGIVFGIESMIYSFIILWLISYYSNRSMLGICEDKVLLINASNPEPIIAFLKNNYHYGITIFKAEGGYSKKDYQVIMCSIKNSLYTEIKQTIKLLDPNCFITVYNSYETIYINKDDRKNRRKES